MVSDKSTRSTMILSISICQGHGSGRSYATHPFYVNQNLPTTHKGFGQSNAAMYKIVAYIVGLLYLKSVRCRWPNCSLLRQNTLSVCQVTFYSFYDIS